MLTREEVGQQIADLLEQAAPLRLLADDDEKAQTLPRLVDKINALRAIESKFPPAEPDETPVDKPKRGRPAKVEA